MLANVESKNKDCRVSPPRGAEWEISTLRFGIDVISPYFCGVTRRNFEMGRKRIG